MEKIYFKSVHVISVKNWYTKLLKLTNLNNKELSSHGFITKIWYVYYPPQILTVQYYTLDFTTNCQLFVHFIMDAAICTIGHWVPNFIFVRFALRSAAFEIFNILGFPLTPILKFQSATKFLNFGRSPKYT